MINGRGNSGPWTSEYAVAEKRTQIGANWFFGIAGVSLISSAIILSGYSYHFVIGFGTAGNIIDFAIMSGVREQNSVKIGAFLFDLLACGFYVLYGVFGRRGAKWAFFTGIVFYALDGVLLIVGGTLYFSSDSLWLSAVFRAYALFRIFQGFQAAQLLGALRMQAALLYDDGRPFGSRR